MVQAVHLTVTRVDRVLGDKVTQRSRLSTGEGYIWVKVTFGLMLHLVLRLHLGQGYIWVKVTFGSRLHLGHGYIWFKVTFGLRLHLGQGYI